MFAFTSLFAVAALVAQTAAATSCQPAVSFGVDFTEQPCAGPYVSHASYQDLGIQFGSSYVWASEAAARAQVKYAIRETQVVAPAHSAPASTKRNCDPSCPQLCLDKSPGSLEHQEHST
ncbi:hypothetical protein FRC10_006666 [Ceratobasidium sp. 414]|nr:hypothetical protein FRC10_006666 [Ceratobasidium sp. 414]